MPVVAVSSAVEYPWVSNFIGNNDNLAYVPNALIMVLGKMNFWQRLNNFFVYYNEIHKFNVLTEKEQTSAMRKYIDPNMPSVREIEKSVALTLVNSHHVLYGVKPITNGLIQVAGLHVEMNESKLSKVNIIHTFIIFDTFPPDDNYPLKKY